MPEGSVWAAVAVAIVMEIGHTIRDYLKWHYHVVQAPTRMNDITITAKCREVDNKCLDEMLKKVDDNTDNLASLYSRMEEVDATAKPADPGTR